MTASPEILRYTAFSSDPAGGNPAGVVLDATDLDDKAMLAIAAEVGYSETAFFVPDAGRPGHHRVRYFSPLAEVAFCGHATIASAVALAERVGPGPLLLATAAGEVAVDSWRDEAGAVVAALTSVPPKVEPVSDDDLGEALAALGWRAEDLDEALPPRLAYAGVWHLVLATASRARLSDLDYDFARLGALMATQGWTTLQLVWRESPLLFHARDPFPPGGVVEDPATGAAAAAFGAYLRRLELIATPARLTLLQGHDMGRPSTLTVDVPTAGPVTVSGHAVPVVS